MVFTAFAVFRMLLYKNGLNERKRELCIKGGNNIYL